MAGGAGGSQLLESHSAMALRSAAQCCTAGNGNAAVCAARGAAGDRGCHPTQGPGLTQDPVNVLTGGEGWQQRKLLNHIVPI